MKKAGNIVVSKFMGIVKSGRNKRIAAAATAVVVAGAVIASSVFSNTQAAENADTLMGIEKLRNQFSEGSEYTILEIVPDLNAAEIGYLFDGYEPVLSEWDSETMTWKSWKDILCGFDTKEERQVFIAEKKNALQAYYNAQGIKDNVPVVIPTEEYDDSEDYKEGYEEVEAGSYDMTGYFTASNTNIGKYYVSFEYINYENILNQPENVYYKSILPITLSADMNIADGTYIYKQDGSLYQCVGTWGELKDSISFPSLNSEEVTDDNDDDNSDDNSDDSNDDTSDDDGMEDNGEEGTGEDGTGEDGSENGEAVTGENDGSDNNDESENGDSANSSNVSASAAVGNSFAQIKWMKLVSIDDDSSKTSDSKGNDSSGTTGGGNNNSSDSSQNNNSDSGSGNNQGGASGDDSGNNQSGNSGDSSGDNQGGDSGDGSGDNQGGDSGDDSGNNQGSDSGDNSGDNQDSDSGDSSGDNQDGDSSDDSGDNQDSDSGDGTDDNQEDGSDNLEDDTDENPDDEDKDSSNGSKKNPGKDNTTTQSISAQSQDEEYYIVYFERETNVSSLTGGAYVVKDIKPAKLGSYNGETEHYTGQYNFTEDKGDNTQTYTFPGRILYCKGIFRNNEWFKQYVINMVKENFDDFNVKVITVTPSDLNNIYENGTEEYEKGTIPDFDFLYLNSGLRTFQVDIAEPQSDGDNGDSGSGGDSGDADNGNNGDEANNSEETVDTEDEESGDGGNTGDDDSSEEPDNAEDSNNSEEPDNSVDSDNSEEPGNAEDSDNGEETHNSENGNNSEDSGNSENSGSVSSKNADNNSNTIASQYTSAWRTYVSKDDSDTALDNNKDNTNSADKGESSTPDNSTINMINFSDIVNAEDEGDTETAGSKANTGDTNSTDKEANADDTDAVNNEGEADNTNSTDDEGNTDDTEGNDSEANTDGTDTSDDSETPADSEETDTPDKEPSSAASGNKTEKTSSVVARDAVSSDLDQNVANQIFKRVAANALPCLVDGSIIYDKAESGAITNKSGENMDNAGIFRLAAMLCQETLEKDYTSVSQADLLKGIVDDADKNFTTEQVYCRLGNGNDSIINDNFFKYTIYKVGGEIEEGFQNVLDEINLENLYRESDSSGNYRALSTNISQAEALRHILNYQNRRSVEPKKSIKVLEIQPALTSEAEITKEQLQKWAPGVEEVETTIMTTAEFIGKIDKLNEIYDLVYIGTSKEHLNLLNWVTDTGKSKDGKYLGSTVFNDSDMDGLIYYNVGDKRVVYLPMSGLLDTEYKGDTGRTYYYNFVRYGGNDITEEKKDALISFLNGSYPIIVSDEFIEQPATVFETEDYTGRRGTLSVGEYTEQDLLDNQIYASSGTPAKGISSIQVKKGYQITLFENADFTGNYITFTESVSNLSSSSAQLASGQTWNNRARSIIVEKVEDAQPVRAIDGNHIDNSSYLYEFVNTALEKKYTNFYVKGDIDETGSELFKFYLNRPKASLVDFTANGLKSDYVNGSSAINDVYYIYPNYLGRYTLQFNFAIQNEGAASIDTRYYCKFYIDVNADGKFSKYEEVPDIVMTNRNTGGSVSPNELYAGNQYTIVRDVPTGYKGLLPWKVEVCQVDNENIYASKQGYTKLDGLDKEVLRICQINRERTAGSSFNDVIDLNKEINTPGSYFNILIYGGDYNGVHYPGITNDFELDVTTITIPQYEEYYNNNNNYLDDFNMLILGFSDMYGDFSGDSESGAMGAIVDFINSGKSVLMAHDTTSFFNNPIVDGTEQGYTERNSSNLAGYSDDTRFAATLNKYIRPLVGMDRYGILSSSILKRGVALREGDSGWNELINSGREIAYKPKSGRKETVPEVHGYTYAVISAKDKRPDGSSSLDYTKYNLYSDGYNDLDNIVFRNSYVSQRFDDCYYWENSASDYGKDNGEMDLVNNGEVWQVHVTQVNQGQITEYPYKLQDDFEVGLTHAQYYQLDYTADDDGDGQSDLVVWYCLGGRTSSTGKTSTIYSQSPNDVRNNYYIYNKGNITYTGMGHASKNYWTGVVWYTFDEAKLFINTMIASYQAGVKPPSITILESGRDDAAPLTTMYRYYDEANMISLADTADNGQYEKVYFTVRDINFINGSIVIASHAYYQVDGGSETITVGGESISVNPLAGLIYNAGDDTPVDAYNLESGGIYYLLVPRDVMSQCEDGLDIYFEAQSTITTNTTKQNVYTTDKVYTKLQVLRAYLFELD